MAGGISMRVRLGVKLALAGLIAVAAHGVSAAGAIDVQFGATGTVFGPTPQYTGAAVVGGASDQWNFAGGTFNPDYLTSTAGWGRTITNQALFDTAGAATGATLSLTTPDAFISLEAFHPFFKTTPYADLMDSFVFADGNRLGNGGGQDGAGLVTLNGLDAGGLYELILLSSGDVIGRATRFTLDGVEKIATPTGIGTFASGDNFVTFLTQADVGGSLSFTFDAASGAEGNLNGLQLVELQRPEIDGGSPTPEPGTWGLMLLGFGAVGGAMRVRRRARLALA
jgi:hypothetical protein